MLPLGSLERAADPATLPSRGRLDGAATLLLVLATFVAVAVGVRDQISANSTAKSLEVRSEQFAKTEQQRATEGTAAIYLSRVAIERRGMLAIIASGQNFQSYLAPQDFDASVSDGLALLGAASTPPGTIVDLSDFSGQVSLLYNDALLKVPLRSGLTDQQLGLVCFAIGYADRLEIDLQRVVASNRGNTGPTPELPSRCGPNGYIPLPSG